MAAVNNREVWNIEAGTCYKIPASIVLVLPKMYSMSQENSPSSYVLLACQRGVDCISELLGLHKEGDKNTGPRIALKWI